MIDRRFLVFIGIILHVVVVSSITDHLIPPPPPPAPVQPAVPAQQLQPADRISPPRTQTYPYRYAGGAQNEPPGFMQRIARWFGFNNDSAREQQLQASQQYVQYKESPRGYQQNGQKAQCGLCNKYPWVPMFPGSFQYPLIKHYQVPQANQIHQVKWTQQQQQQLYQQQQINQQQIQQHQINQQQVQQQQQQQQLSPQQQAQLAGYNYPQHQQQLPPYPPLNEAETKYAPTHFQPPLVQRAVQFNSQPSQDFRPPPPPIQTGNPPPPYVPQPHFAPIPVPNLSPSALPPIYDAQPFRPVQQPQPSLEPVQFQQLPKYEPTVSFQAKPQSTPYEQEQPPRIADTSSFQQVGENVYPSITENIVASSEIQTAYPTQSPSGYQDQQQPQQPQPPQQLPTTPGFEIIKSHQVTNFVSEIEYPANFEQSQSIDVPQEQPTTTAAPEIQHPITLTELGSYSPLYTSPTEEPPAVISDDRLVPTDTIIYHNHQEVDNYATDNFPSASSHNLSVQHENHLDIDPIQHSSSENYLPQNEIFLPTIEPTTLQPQFVTDDSQHTTVEIVPSLQTTYSQRLNYKRNRETPKRLLDSPIHYLQGGSSPRPFTKDPAELHIRSSTIIPLLQNHREESLSTPTPWHRAPTPTSTYSSIDASGHFAGMTPPAQQQPIKQYHQIIIPYTTKHKPRPFQPKEHAGRYENWTNDFDPHEQQESKLVTATQPTAQPTTKYLTKILASNLRELLKKEHEIKNKSKNGFDLSKLQKNIDDWTEQEFTSLSHRASTVSLRGHSKHIPTEYLTTTPSFREPKTTVFSPNHLEPLLYKDRGTKRYEFHQVESNRIEPQDVPSTTVAPSKTTTTTPVPSMTTTKPPTVTPFYIRAVSTTRVPKENWNKAKVTVSPLTKEKIYVVTPQPTIAPGGVGSFKSPRFIVRPTPASGSTTIRPSLYTPELFGLMGISAYIPAAPVETIDGHSKVITVVTPSNSIKRSEDNEIGSAVESASSNANQSDQSSS